MSEAELRDRLAKLMPPGCQYLLTFNDSMAIVRISRQGEERTATIPRRGLERCPETELRCAVEHLLQRLDIRVDQYGNDEWMPANFRFIRIKRIG
jgi:hypothetical protein